MSLNQAGAAGLVASAWGWLGPEAPRSHQVAGGKTMAPRLNPYLNFNGNARQALEFYASVFGVSWLVDITQA